MRKIIFHLNCLEQGGAERVVTNLAKQFKEDGNDVIIATEWQAKNEFVLPKGIRRIHVGLQLEDESNNRIVKYLKRIKYLRDLVQTEQPDILIAFAQKANYRAVMSTLFTKVPVLTSVRTNPVGFYDDLVNRVMILLFLSRSNGTVFQTVDQQEFFPRGMQKKSRIILNPINSKYIGRELIHHRTKEIVHSGRLVDCKNQAMLVEAFAVIHKKFPDYTLKIYGGDSFDGTKEQLKEVILLNHLEQYVFLMGASDSLEGELENGAFFVMTSDLEGLPNALMEAMALGIPCIATDCPCGGPATLIEHGANGYLIPVKDKEKLIEAMEYFIENPYLVEAYGEKARKIAEIANVQAIYEQWKDYVETLCSKG